MFGIDKRNYGTLDIARAHDFEKLKGHNNVSFNTRGDMMKLYDQNTGEVYEFESISIKKDEKFNHLKIGLKKEKGVKREFARLEVFIDDDKGTANLKPYNKEQTIKQLEELLKYIKDKYGLNLGCSNAKYTYLEINKTIELDEDVELYRNVLEYFTYIAPARYTRKQINKSGANLLNLIALENNSVKIKLYNKTKQLKEYKKVNVEGYFLRIEICLKDSRKIKNAFGTTEIHKITDEMMWEYFFNMVKKDLFDRLDKQLEKAKPKLKQELRLQKKEDSKKYPKIFLLSACSLNYEKTEIPLILDVEQVFEVLKPTVARWDRTYKTLKKEIDKRPHKKNNLARYDEIKNKTLLQNY